jgi:hypothetical protein
MRTRIYAKNNKGEVAARTEEEAMLLKSIVHKFIVNFIIVLIPLTLSCSSFLTTKYKDVVYICPTFIPNSNIIAILKNVHIYNENGGAGGTNTDDISSTWSLLQYDVSTSGSANIPLPSLSIDPFTMNKGITSASDSFLTIIGNDRLFIFDLTTHSLKEYPADIDLEDACSQYQSHNILEIRSSGLSYALISLDINSGVPKNLLGFTNLFNNIAMPPVPNPRFSILSGNPIGFFDNVNDSLLLMPMSADYVCAYDSNKIAAIQSTNEVSFMTFGTDSLFVDTTIVLTSPNPFSITVSKSARYLVYQASYNASTGSIILRDMASSKETLLFSQSHETE